MRETDPVTDPDPARWICPELCYREASPPGAPPWTTLDPRIDWLIDTLRGLAPEKVLVITTRAVTVRDIAEALRRRAGIHAAVFHEQMSLVERDRAAAWFADPDAGSRLLLCSEIGSEGRNFQFARHLVLFDLPLLPDVLEQRIGRLDRIGQGSTINLHIPYLVDTSQALLYRWYADGLDAFRHTCPMGYAVYTDIKPRLLALLVQHAPEEPGIAQLVEDTRALRRDYAAAMARGRDRLLEYNSCRPDHAAVLLQAAEELEQAGSLTGFMEAVFDCYGVQIEEHGMDSWIIRPGERMVSPFPGLPDDGLTLTWSRDTALACEDRHYLTWEHPMVANAMDMILGSESGNAALGGISNSGLPPGTLLVEALYVFNAGISGGLSALAGEAEALVRVVVDERNGRAGAGPDPAFITANSVPVSSELARLILERKAETIRTLLPQAEEWAGLQGRDLIGTRLLELRREWSGEADRLRSLQRVNPNVRDEEIEYLERRIGQLQGDAAGAVARLDAVRVLVAV